MNNRFEIGLLADLVWDDLQSAKERMEDLKKELLANREYGLSDHKKFDELLFAQEQLESAMKHFSSCADNVIKILEL